MSPLNLLIEDQRTGQSHDVRRAAHARELIWECVPAGKRLTATELADAIYRPHCKFHRDFSAELARRDRWLSSRTGRTLPIPIR